MKHVFLIIAVAIVSAAGGYFVAKPDRPAALPGPGTDLQWIRTEFALNDAQFAAVQSLHEKYSGQCAQHCADIIAARHRLEELRASQPPPAAADLTAAEHRLLELEAFCNEATRAHVRRVSAAMPAEQGERFLRTVEPHLAQLPHDGVRGLGH